MFSCFADAVLSDSELTFVKFIGYLLLILWPAYLTKEIFFHKPDPAISALTAAVTEQAKSTAMIQARMESTDRAVTELKAMQIRDTDAIFRKIDELGSNFQSAIREHDRELGKLDGVAKSKLPSR